MRSNCFNSPSSSFFLLKGYSLFLADTIALLPGSSTDSTGSSAMPGLVAVANFFFQPLWTTVMNHDLSHDHDFLNIK
jgi:hypothetical protein